MGVPGYYTQKEVLSALGMSRQNFYQTGLAAVLRPAATIGRSQLYRAEDVGLWSAWLRYRKALIAMEEWPTDTPLVPESGRIPWYIETGEFEWQCSRCGGLAYSPPGDPLTVWCPIDGYTSRSKDCVARFGRDEETKQMEPKYKLYNFESGEWENSRILSANECRRQIDDDMEDPDIAPLWRDQVWGYVNVADDGDAIMYERK